jgi:hypothetical protein
MKRRNFFASLGLATAMVAVPSIANAATGAKFAHVPRDYAQVQEEPEEFQDLDEALTNEWYAQDIAWS